MIKIRQVKIPIEKDSQQELRKKIIKLLHINSTELIDLNIRKKSIDARDKKQIYYIYELSVSLQNEDSVLNRIHSKDILKEEPEDYIYPSKGIEKLKTRIVIVGSGPAGLFCGYLLSEMGYKPLIIERGKKAEERIKDVEEFWESGILNTESNVQFGEGGAGTFSDGKLNTLVKDKRHLGKKVFEIFVKFGAPKEILYLQKPHIGTDILRNVIKNMRTAIINMGGEFRYSTKLTNLIIKDGILNSIEVNNQEIIPCNNLVLAIGHSARDTIEMLKNENLNIVPKPFAIGIRVMHSQEMINKSQYKDSYKLLPPASYKLTYTTKQKRGVYSFCMCPGGYVVNASSEEKRLAINGMSNYKRDSQDANSAIIVTVSPEDFGYNIMDGINFQRNLEEKAYNLCQGKIPLQLLKDFKENKKSTTYKSIVPITKGNYEFTNLREILPEFISNSLIEAFENFGRKIKGFDSDDTLLAAVESRSSSPVKIVRDEHFESNIKGIYPCGEGAGYAGGITTSAIDGIKVAEALIQKYSNN